MSCANRLAISFISFPLHPSFSLAYLSLSLLFHDLPAPQSVFVPHRASLPEVAPSTVSYIFQRLLPMVLVSEAPQYDPLASRDPAGFPKGLPERLYPERLSLRERRVADHF